MGCGCSSERALTVLTRVLGDLMRMLHDHESIQKRPVYSAVDVAERQLLGEILTTGEVPAEAGTLEPGEFENEARGRIFAVLLLNPSRASLATLEVRWPDPAWGPSLDSLVDGCYHEGNVAGYVRIIREAATRRKAGQWAK